MNLVKKNKFVAIVLDLEDGTSIVHVAVYAIFNGIHPSFRAQIALFKVDETYTTVFFEYSNFADSFSLELIAELLEYIEINIHTIDLIDGKQLLYRPIHSLELVEFKTFKINIKTNLANDFIRPFKSIIDASILFFRSLLAAFIYKSIIKVLIILLSRINTGYF